MAPRITDTFSPQQISYLKAWMQPGSYQPPLLITGSHVDHLNATAQQIAHQAICLENNTACTECRACKLFAAGNHPDMISMSNHEAKAPTIKTLRQMLNTVAQTALSPIRVIVLSHIDQYSLPAINLLLKSLEEPALSSRYILTSRFLLRLPQTIRSRCHMLYSSPMTEQPVAKKAISEILSLWPKNNVRLTEQQLSEIGTYLITQAKEIGPSPEIKRALLRFRDYYKMQTMAVNEKLARDILLASVDSLALNQK